VSPLGTRVPIRCAVYTRTSSNEKIGQAFGSIMAQRQAGIAHIASHAESNWRPIAQTYSDPDVSGSTLERDGLSHLLSDIDAGRIDVVIVQKIDRLTRSMMDFVKLLELFDQHGVALVSVTQHLNSQDATGRLSINTLISFAQFEREITGERIRDKIKATRRKGLWAGSIPPLGYEVRNQHLLIKKTEADLVRRIFKRFVAIGSITELLKVLKNDEVTTKQWITQMGKIRGGHAIDKTYIYKVLNNRIYLGELLYDDAWHEGIHSPIIPIALWHSCKNGVDPEKVLPKIQTPFSSKAWSSATTSVPTPLRQTSCRSDMMLILGAIRTNDGSVWRSIQKQSSGAVVAAGERQYWRSSL